MKFFHFEYRWSDFLVFLTSIFCLFLWRSTPEAAALNASSRPQRVGVAYTWEGLDLYNQWFMMPPHVINSVIAMRRGVCLGGERGSRTVARTRVLLSFKNKDGKRNVEFRKLFWEHLNGQACSRSGHFVWVETLVFTQTKTPNKYIDIHLHVWFLFFLECRRPSGSSLNLVVFLVQFLYNILVYSWVYTNT